MALDGPGTSRTSVVEHPGHLGNYVEGVALPPLPILAPAAPFRVDESIASADGRTVVHADTEAPATTVVHVSDGTSGRSIAAHQLAGDNEVLAVSAGGGFAALRERDAPGSTSTTSRINVVDLATGAARLYRPIGLVIPEAFSTDGTLLYVIDHGLGTADGDYRVRPLDLSTGRLLPALGPTKEPIVEEMNGIGGRQLWSPDASRLYTLYTRQTHAHSGAAAEHSVRETRATDGFVHVLDLDEKWAFYLDLPAEFGTGPIGEAALAVSPDGRELAVFDVAAGAIAFASTTSLEVTSVRTLAAPLPTDGTVHLAFDGEVIVVGSDGSAHHLDRLTLTPRGEPHRHPRRHPGAHLDT